MATTSIPQPGTVVRYRDRRWVVLPEQDDGLVVLRPVAGAETECVTIDPEVLDLLRSHCAHERLQPDRFPAPDATQHGDHLSVWLVTQAARLLIRRGATPFCSLGRLAFRPRPYQLVPLMMALRQQPPVRLLIADDVGVGKTLEAGLILREWLDRGAIRRSAVLCPPQLCEQWRLELLEKLGIEAVVIRGASIAQLERRVPPNRSVFEYYPHLVVSIDTVKNPRYRPAFTQYCPEFVIVDEVHGAARPAAYEARTQEKQRYELVREIAADPKRHLVLLTATPHSGIEESFRSLLEFLDPSFGAIDWAHATGDELDRLRQHYVQRQRSDLAAYLEGTRFPKRIKREVAYRLTDAYELAYRKASDLAWDLLEVAAGLDEQQRRPCYWAALALLRCVSSSPRAGERALQGRLKRLDQDQQSERSDTAAEIDAAELLHLPPVQPDEVGEADDEADSAADTAPSGLGEQVEALLGRRIRNQLGELTRRCAELAGPEQDAKLRAGLETVTDLLREGHQPIVWCRYIATAEYVAENLRRSLERALSNVAVECITGALPESERVRRLEELAKAARRVLVATDCISEGTNLQEHFSAVIHYDLPWNPNRLEQREGRVDRYGQTRDEVVAVMLLGENNPLDGAVLEVLLRKASEIFDATGVFVPVPIQNEAVLESILAAVLARAEGRQQQRRLLVQSELERSNRIIQDLKTRWEEAAHRENQRRKLLRGDWIPAELVQQEMARADNVLGQPHEVLSFVFHALPALGYDRPAASQGSRLTIDLSRSERALPESLRWRLAPYLPTRAKWRLSCESPPPEGYRYLGRTHPLVEGLAEVVLHRSLGPDRPQAELPLRRVAEPSRRAGTDHLARAGVIRTDAVSRLTTVFVLRPRYLVHTTTGTVLAEEILCWPVEGLVDAQPLPLHEGRRLLDEAKPVGNVSETEKTARLNRVLGDLWPQLVSSGAVQELIHARIQELTEAHLALNADGTGTPTVRIEPVPQGEPDLVAVLVLVPVPPAT